MLALVACAFVLSGCAKKSGEAIVIGKDYVPAIEREEATPSASSPAAEDATSSASPIDESAETIVDTTDFIGPPIDSRATHREQWIVAVEMIEGGRKIDVRVDPGQFDALKEGDRVRVEYREGKYTGTVWSSSIK
ncbi:MAG TPA: hypothetical protein VF551_01895 [Chthoniobacterales bacterium]